MSKTKKTVKRDPFYILRGHKIVVTKDAIKWGKMFSSKKRIVAQTTTFNGYFISTVFLGIDHGFGETENPILFETMVFDCLDTNHDDREQACYRWCTWEEAEAGHKEIVSEWRRKHLDRYIWAPPYAVFKATCLIFGAYLKQFKEELK